MHIKIYGPYRVIDIGNNDPLYQVVEMADPKDASMYRDLRPSRSYKIRQSAYNRCRRLNQKWQEENFDRPDLLKRWEESHV